MSCLGPRSLGLLIVVILTAATVAAAGEPETAAIRVALLSQWVINQHRQGVVTRAGAPMRPEFRTALERGVVDRPVFSGERGLIERDSLAPKPIRALSGLEAAPLGGRGEFELVAVRPRVGAEVWREMVLVPRTRRPDDVLVLEVGGELSTIAQVLETIFVVGPGGSLVELGLARSALIPGEGVRVVQAAFGRPLVRPDASALFRGIAGVELLVVRSLVETMVDAGSTTRGLADVAPSLAVDWREGDRVFVRVALATLRAGRPALVLGWKDRISLPPLGR